MCGPGRRTADGLTFVCQGKVYLKVVYEPPLVREAARISRHCRYWVSESNTPYASTDASAGDCTGLWELRSGRRMQLSCGSQAVGAWGEDAVQRGMVSGAGGGKI